MGFLTLIDKNDKRTVLDVLAEKYPEKSKNEYLKIKFELTGCQ